MPLSISGSPVNQTSAQADGDIVGRDKNTVIVHTVQPSALQAWAEKLNGQIESNETIARFVDSLEFFATNHPEDDIVGLEDKLKHAGREREVSIAIKKKEFFSMLLEKWQHYEAAQEIFAFYLHLIENRFSVHIAPVIGDIEAKNLDSLIHQHVVTPVLAQAATVGVFILNENHVMGMVYWLAEKCYVRWHK